MADRLRVAQIGCGRWGRNLLRELQAHALADVALVIDPRAEAQLDAARLAPGVCIAESLEALASTPLDAVVIATPGPLHAAHARIALARGLHVFVEKPMAMKLSDALEMAEQARAAGTTAMVGHLLRYHPAVCALVSGVRSGTWGRPLALRSERHSVGARDVDGSLLWSLAPHDISILLALEDGAVELTRAEVRTFASSEIRAELHLQGASGMRARIRVSRGGGEKVRKLRVRCEHAVVEFNDLAPAGSKLTVERNGAGVAEPLAFGEELQPLRQELDVFVRWALEGRAVPSGFDEGVAVVRLLEQAESLSDTRSRPVLALAR